MPKTELIRELLKENIALATGCTEPVAVALCVAKAKEILGNNPDKIELYLSKNVIKNAMGVGIPGTGMIGLPIAVSLGVVCGDSSKELDVLNNSSEFVEKAKEWMSNHTIDVKPAKTNEKLYIECIASYKDDKSIAIIASNHTKFIHLQKNEEIIYHEELIADTNTNSEVHLDITAKDVYEYAINSPIEEISWIIDTIEVNKKASEAGINGNFGLQVGKMLLKDIEPSTRKTAIGKTCAASDARMDGATTPVYSNSGSGNQGITCTIPVYEFAIRLGKSNEEIIRALMLSSLMSIYVKQYIGRLSALCGIVNASIGVSAALVYLQEGTFEQIGYAVKNMINTVTGMICDGAKPSCALKVATGLNAAFDASNLALKNTVVDETDGISEFDLDRSIKNLGQIGRYGMDVTDNLILEIMTNKVYS